MRTLINILWISSRILLILTTLVVFSLPTYSITSSEKLKLQSEITGVCNYYNKPCGITFNHTDKVQGYTTRLGIIVLTDGLCNKLNYNEVRAVALHELGHHMLNHYQRTDEFIDNWNLALGTLKKFRYKMETEADLYATAYVLLRDEHNYLPEALTKITVDNYSYKTDTNTHPSTLKRIETINKFTKEHNQ